MLVGLLFARRKTETVRQSRRVCETQALTFFAITWLPQTIPFSCFWSPSFTQEDRVGVGKAGGLRGVPGYREQLVHFLDGSWQDRVPLTMAAATLHSFPLTKWAENKEEGNKQGLLLDRCGSGFLLLVSLQSLPFRASLSLEHGEGPCELSSLCLWSTVWQPAAWALVQSKETSIVLNTIILLWGLGE